MLPCTIGRAPSPYAPILTGAEAVPEPLTASPPLQVRPRRSSTVSPGESVSEATFASDFHGADWEVPAALSLPAVAST